MKKEEITLNKLKEENPKARIGSFSLGKNNEKAFLIAEKSRDEYLSEIFSSISEPRANIMFCFETWFFATKLKIEKEKIATAGNISVGEVEEIIKKYSKVFEFIEASLNNYSFYEGVFKIFLEKELKEVKK